MGRGKFALVLGIVALLGAGSWAQEYGLEIMRVEPLGGSPWLVPGVPKVVMRIYVEDNDTDNADVVITAIRVGQDPKLLPVPSTEIEAIRIYDVTQGGAGTLIAEALSPTLPSYDPTTTVSGLALTWKTSGSNYVIPDDGHAVFEVEMEVDPTPTSFTEGESFRLVVEFQQTEDSTIDIVKCVVDDQEDIVSTVTADKGLETVSDERVGAGALAPGAQKVLVQDILLKDSDDDQHNCVIDDISVYNLGTGTPADLDYIWFELDGYDPVKVAVNSFPVTLSNPGWMVPDDTAKHLRIYVDVSNSATNTHTFKFSVVIIHTEGGSLYGKWVHDEEEEYINVPPGIAGLEVIEDENIGAGLLSPGGDYDTVMEITLVDHDPPVYNSDVTVYGIVVDNQGDLPIDDVAAIEVRHGSQLLGKVTDPATNWGNWGGPIDFSTPVVIPDEGSFDIQIKILLTPDATNGATLRLQVGIEHMETGSGFLKWVSDGTEEVVSDNQIDKGLEVLYVVPEPSSGTIAPNETKKVLTLHLEDKDGDADEDDVYITEIRLWNDIRHPGAGVLPLADREDLFQVIVEGAGAPMVISVSGSGPLEPPLGVAPIVITFTGAGLRIPDDGSLDLVFKVTANEAVTNGAALRFYIEVDQTEGTNSFTKTDPDGAEEWFSTTSSSGGGGDGGGSIDIGDATLNSGNGWTAWVPITIDNCPMQAMTITGQGITFDPSKLRVVDVQGEAGKTLISTWAGGNTGHLTLSLLVTAPSGSISNGVIARLKVQRAPGFSGSADVNLSLNPSDVSIDGGPCPCSVTGGTVTIEEEGGGCGTKGDVNNDGSVTLLDAVWVAEYVMGQRTLDSCALWRADVDCDNGVDIMDAYYIVQYVMNGRPFPCATGTSSLAVEGEGNVLVTLSGAAPAGLELAFAAPGLAVVHGELALQGDDLKIARLVGKDGAQVLSFRVLGSGVVEFIAVFAADEGSLALELAHGSLKAASLISLTAFNAEGASLKPKVEFEGVEPLEPKIISVSNEPNPVRDVHTTYFRVQATVPVKEIRVLIYDLSGRLVYDSGWVENGYAWHLEDLSGKVVANGVYLYVVQVKLGDTVVHSKIRKLAVLR